MNTSTPITPDVVAMAPVLALIALAAVALVLWIGAELAGFGGRWRHRRPAAPAPRRESAAPAPHGVPLRPDDIVDAEVVAIEAA